MKKSVFILLAFLPMMLQAGVIVKTNGDRLEDISIQSSEGNEFVYMDENGVKGSVPRSEVSAVLYDDGRYEEIKQEASVQSVSNQLGIDESNLQEYISSGQVGLVLLYMDDSYSAECRKVGKKVYNQKYREFSQAAMKEAKRSGMSSMEAGKYAYEQAFPQAVKASNDALRECEGQPADIDAAPVVAAAATAAAVPAVAAIAEEPAPVVETPAAPVEEEYVPTQSKKAAKKAAKQQVKEAEPEPKAEPEPEPEPVVEPAPVVEAATAAVAATAIVEAAPAEEKVKAEKRVIPKGCQEVAKLEYDKAYQEAMDKALEQGYSKSQAYKMAYDAGMAVKQKVIDECYDQVVVAGVAFATAYPELAQAKAEAEQAKANAAEAKRLEQEKRKHEADSIKAAKLAEKEQAQADYEARRPYFVTKSGSKYLCMGEAMNKKAYKRFLQNNCPAAYKKYKSGTAAVQAGWTFFSIGLVMNAGWALVAVPIRDIVPIETDFDFETLGFATGIAGACLVGVSIPLLAGGYAARNKSMKVYNMQCASPNVNKLSLNFGPTPNGLGMRLTF